MSQEPDLFSSEKIANAILAFIGMILGGVIVAFIVGEGRFAGVGPTRNQWIAMTAGIPFLVVIALMINRRQRLLELLKIWRRRIRNNWQLIAGVALFLVAVCGAFALTWSPWSVILVLALTSSNVLLVIWLHSRTGHKKLEESHVIFRDKFDGFSGWNQYEGGIVSQSNEIAPRVGRHVLKKDGPKGDPTGGWKKTGRPINLGFVFSGWIYRPEKWIGGHMDRLAVEDNTYHGYGFAIDHEHNQAWIERRDGKGEQGKTIPPAIPLEPTSPVDQWYRFEFTARPGGELGLRVCDRSGNPLVDNLTVSDEDYDYFDRVGVHGGSIYYVDELEIRTLAE